MKRQRGERLRLEASKIASLVAVEGKRTDYADTLFKGLILRVTPAGVRTFVLLYRFQSHVRRYKLGRWPEMSLGDARRAARRVRGRVDSGEDPHAEKVALRRSERVKTVTLGFVLERFVAHLQSGDFGRTTKVQWPQMIDKDLLPVLRPLTPEDPRVRGAVAGAIDGVMKRGSPAQANRTLDLIRRAWRWGIERGLIPSDAPYPFLALKKPHRARPRERFYSPDEIKALWTGMEGEKALYRDWWRLLWWTGARSSEVAEMKWSEVDLESGRWIRIKTKGRKPLVLTLPRQAREALQGRAAVSPGHTAAIFPAPGGPGPLPYGSRWWVGKRLREIVPDYQHHDIRRTVRTGLAELGVRYEVAEMVLGHSAGKIAETYNRHLYQTEIAEALQRWGDRLDQIMAPD